MTALRDARRARGWSQARLLHEVSRRAEAARVTTAGAASMKTALSRWENGHRLPDEFYRRLFRDIFDLSDEQLGFAAAASVTLVIPHQVSDDLVGSFTATLDGYQTMDKLVGHGPLLAAVRGQAEYLEALTRSVSGAIRIDLLRLASRYAEFAGWVHQDAGDLTAAMYWTDRAMDCAYELDDPVATSYVLHRKSNIATDAGHAGLALGLAEAALRNPSPLPPQLRAVALRQRANASAMNGDRDGCAAALDGARAALADDDEAGAFAPYCTPAYIEMEAGACWLKLGDSLRAVQALTCSAEAWPTGQDRDRGLCLARLAAAHAVADAPEAAAATGVAAVEAVRAANSARSLAQLRHVRLLLAGSRSVGAANQFETAFTAAFGGAAG